MFSTGSMVSQHCNARFLLLYMYMDVVYDSKTDENLQTLIPSFAKKSYVTIVLSFSASTPLLLC